MAQSGLSGGDLHGASNSPADGPPSSPPPVPNRLSFKAMLSSILKPKQQPDASPPQPPEAQAKDTTEPPESPTEPSIGTEGSLSLPVMADSFRRFNARCDICRNVSYLKVDEEQLTIVHRIGVLFYLQKQLLDILSWKVPARTLSFMFIISFACLHPTFVFALPPAAFLLLVMVPSFLARYPPPPSTPTSSTIAYYSYDGPALAPPPMIKPAPETSKDFLNNLRDLQVSMAQFSVAYDAVMGTVLPAVNFSNSTVSSLIFLAVFFMTVAMIVMSHRIPWGTIALVSVNACFIAIHPSVQPRLTEIIKNPKLFDAKRGYPARIIASYLPINLSAVPAYAGSTAALSMDSNVEEREVEIFELQHKITSPYSSTPEWETFLFTQTPYEPLSPLRIAGDRPKGTRFFEGIRAPPGWTWKTAKWELDLECREWVLERMVTGVQFEVSSASEYNSTPEAVSGWVWDIIPETFNDYHTAKNGVVAGVTDHADEALQTSARQTGDKYEMPHTSTFVKTMEKEDIPSYANEEQGAAKPKPPDKGKAPETQDLEESLTVTPERTGEWRRRRWVRLVKRIPMEKKD